MPLKPTHWIFQSSYTNSGVINIVCWKGINELSPLLHFCSKGDSFGMLYLEGSFRPNRMLCLFAEYKFAPLDSLMAALFNSAQFDQIGHCSMMSHCTFARADSTLPFAAGLIRLFFWSSCNLHRCRMTTQLKIKRKTFVFKHVCCYYHQKAQVLPNQPELKSLHYIINQSRRIVCVHERFNALYGAVANE